jgi:amidase
VLDIMDATQNCTVSARELARLIRTREVSAREVMAAHLARISRINPAVTAIVAMRPDAECLALADQADGRVARGDDVGPLHGLPVAFKDTEPAVGFPFTQGSPIFKDLMPADDSAIVARIRAAGAIPIGKTNVPEFAMGSQTYNRVYGTTRNPYDLTKTAGGSSGGAAAAVTCGLLPLADGGDLGGSIRNPANYTNIVGLRPSVGLVPLDPVTVAAPVTFSVKGPLARSVDDVALLLAVMAGRPELATVPAREVTRVRIAWCPDLGGLPLDRRVRAVLHAQRATLERLGWLVEDAVFDFQDADDIFLTIRRWRSWQALGPLLAGHRDQMKPEAVMEIEAGAAVTPDALARAVARHAAFSERLRDFQERYPFLACAVSQVPPFDAATPWPREIDGVRMETYTDWMKSAYWISTTRCPAISVPAGFTPEGLPVGIQLVGRHGDDRGVLQLAAAFEAATGIGKIRPPIAET